MSKSTYSINDIKIGTLVTIDDEVAPEIVISIWDDVIFFTMAKDGTVMEYNIKDITSIVGHKDIAMEIAAISKHIC